jgi:regulatory protein
VQRRRRRSSGPPEPRRPPNTLDSTFRLLAQRPHSELELRRKLLARGCPADEVDQSIARAGELGYLDDAAYAAALVSHRARSRGAGVIAAELAAKGVSREVARAAVAAVDHEAAVAAARSLAARSPGVELRKLAARLARRGFGHDVVREALSREARRDGDLT